MSSLAYRRRPSLPAVLAAGLVAVLLAVSPALPGSPQSTAVRPAAFSAGSYLKVADYFGGGWPVNVWNSDLSAAASDFARIKKDGFNTVGLVIPWGEFQVVAGSSPVDDPKMLDELVQLIKVAGQQGLKVVLRLSYGLDNDPADNPGGGTRFQELFTNSTIYNSWLEYISKIHSTISNAGLSNVAFPYLSWEDFWVLVQMAKQHMTTAQSINLAVSTGYQSWLKAHYSLSAVDQQYGRTFSSWAVVPLPSYSSPSFRYMYGFFDSTLVYKLLLPAMKIFPGMLLEARVDTDPIYSGSTIVARYSHAGTYAVTGTKATGMYFSPYMDDPSTAKDETASQALQALKAVLSGMAAHTGGRPLYVSEFEFVSNAPQVANDPALMLSQVPTFLVDSAPLLQQYTNGYAVWTYRNFNTNLVYNPSFAVATNGAPDGWTISRGTATASTVPGTATPDLVLGANSAVTQPISGGANAGWLGTGKLYVFLHAESAASALSTTVKITVDGGTFSCTVSAWANCSHVFPLASSGLPNYNVTITSSAPAAINNLQMYSFTQNGDLYTPAWGALSGLSGMRTLNSKM